MPSFTYQQDTGDILSKDPPMSSCPEPIAIVGMGCRWPGAVSNPSQLWDLLSKKENGYQSFTDEKMHCEGFYHPNPQRLGSFNTRGGFFLQEDPRKFDHAFFGISPSEVLTMDPSQRKLLEVVYEAFENAGEPWDRFSGSRTGVYVGNYNLDHAFMQSRDLDRILPYATTGGSASILSNRVSFVFNLWGPSVTLDTACSSSMYALHLAVNAIRNGDCDAAITAGSNLILSPDLQLFSAKLGAMSSTSTCHTFDAAADGYARGEGFGAFYLKKMSEAIKNQDLIRAVIRGTAVNANGRGAGITNPNPEAQERVIRQAFKNSGDLNQSLTAYFECHGTGTPVGDPLEVSAIGRVFASDRQRDRLLIGSVKTNLGHSGSSSGMAGVMKTVLAIEHATIPPTVGPKNPNPNIDFDGAKVEVVTEMTPWPAKHVRRACINSFGFGGANACCILDDADSVVSAYLGYGSSSESALNANLNGGISKDGPFHRCRAKRTHPPYVLCNDFCGIEMTTIRSRGNELSLTNGDKEKKGLPCLNSSNSLDNYSKLDCSNRANTTAYENQFLAEPTETNSISTSTVLTKHPTKHTRRLVLLPFSSHDEYSLKANIAAAGSVIGEHNLSDLAYTLSSRRSRFLQRGFAIIDTANRTSALNPDTLTFRKCPGSQVPRIGFVFSGQGAQWADMGAELISEYAIFRASIRYQDAILAKLSLRPTWSIEQVMLTPTGGTNQIHDPLFSQTLCTALQIALVDLLKSWNVQPVATVGNSSGEIAAAYAAGAHTAAEAIVMAYVRGYVCSRSKQKGLMLAVGLSSDAIRPYLQGKGDEIQVAAMNSPESITLSGNTSAISDLMPRLENEKIFFRLLKTGDQAYHSHHMTSLGEEYEHLAHHSIREIKDDISCEPVVKDVVFWQSSVSPGKRDPASPGPAYWRQNMSSPVLFSQAVESLVCDGSPRLDILIEIGPHPVLAGPLKQIFNHVENEHGGSRPLCLATMRRSEDVLQSMLSLCGQLFTQNSSVDLAAVNSMDHLENGILKYLHGSLCLDLPTYRYDYEPIKYHENRFNRELRLRKHLRHDILGARQPCTSSSCPSWRNALRRKDVPWLEDHKLLPHVVFPAACYFSMAIEALSQLHTESIETPKIAGYSLRKISITSALQVPASDIGIDTVLSMQPVHWSNARALPQWWQFAISSAVPDSDSWTEHCTGQIRVETTQGEIRPLAESSVHLRQNKMDAWYERFAELGILYGPTFRGLSKLKAHYREKKAMADVVLEPTKHTFAGESEYVIHPATLDMCLQLGLVASYSGQVEDVQHVYVPIAVENMSIWLQKSAGGPSRMGQAIAVSNNRGIRSVCSDIQLFNESGAPMVQIGNLRCTLYDGVPNQQVVTSYPRDPYCRLRWKPDIEDLSNEQARRIFQPVILMEAVGPFMARAELLATYLIIQVAELQDKIAHGTIPDHLQTFLKWVKRSFAKICSRGLLGSSEALLESFAHRSQIIDSLSKEMNDHVEVRLVKRLYDDLPAILANETSSLQVALQDNLLTTIYETGFISYAYPQFLRVLDLLAHKNPRMKIIEIGAGTGGATRIAMQALSSGASSKLYKNYTFTDITASFFAHAQEEFSESKGMTFKKLDIGDDPFKQGFSSDYELAIASQSLHTTPTLANTVQNVRKLLRPGGKLLLLEITRELNLIGLIFGTFPDYWNGAEDGRIDSPFISKEQWSELLINNGFSGIDIVLDDLPELASTVSTILATAVEPIISPQAAEPSLRPSVFVVYTKELPLFATSIARVLHAGGIDGVCVPLSDARLLQSSRVISIVDLHNSPLSGADQAEFEGARDLVLRAATLVWVSAGGLMNACRPTAALIQGLMATVAIERPSTRYATIDLDPCFDQQAEHVAQTIIQKEASLNGKPSTASMDTEYIMSDGCLQMSRMIPDRTLNDHFRLREGYSKHTEMLLVGSLEPVKLEFEQPGILKSIYYKSDKEYLQPLHHDYVEVKLMAATLSRSAMTVTSSYSDDNLLRLGYSGIVHNIGNNVIGLSTGDRVWGFAPGQVSNFTRVPARALQKMSPTDSFATMAALPVDYLTAIYAFMHLSHLTEEDTVLIDCARGTLDAAALCIARHSRARAYIIADSPEYIKMLKEKLEHLDLKASVE